MRVVALVSVISALTITYVLLRTEYGRVTVVLALLATWAQPVVVNVAFDARFYGPWLFAAAWLVVEVFRRLDRADSAGWWSGVRLAIASVFVCTVHYFGVLSWGAVLLVAAARCGVRPRPDHGAGLAGPIVLACCLPLYRGQRGVLTVPTWIPDPSVADVLFLLIVVLLPVVTAIVLLFAGLNVVLLRFSKRPAPPRGPRAGLASYLLLSQLIVPLTLAVFSLVVQPATQPRYWVVAALASVPVLARALASAGALVPIRGDRGARVQRQRRQERGDAARLRASRRRGPRSDREAHRTWIAHCDATAAHVVSLPARVRSSVSDSCTWTRRRRTQIIGLHRRA